jgi:AcrR family transcriptional regulator
MPGTSEHKRLQIMTGAEKLLGVRRFHEITMDDVARTAGVGKGTIYRYFRDKDDLFAQVATSGYDELNDLIRGVDPSRSARERLAQACKLIGDFFAARRQLFRVMQTEEARLAAGTKGIRKRMFQQRYKIVDALAEVIRQGVEAGQIRDDIDPQVLAAVFLGMLRTRARDLQDMPEPMRSHEMILKLFFSGAVAENGRSL